MGCHRRYVSVLKALLTTDAEDITSGQKRHTRNSGSTYLSERMPEQMLQVGQTFGTDATSSKTLLADDTALRRIVINITCGQKRHTRNSGSTYLSERMPEQMLQVGQTFGTDATSSKTLLADDTALRRIVINITCGQKRHTRNSGSTYLSERMPEQMLQVGQTFGTDATSSKTLLADDTALRRIVIRTSKSAPQTTVLDHFHLHMRRPVATCGHRLHTILIKSNQYLRSEETQKLQQKKFPIEANESNRSEKTQLSSYRLCAPTCPAIHTGVRRHSLQTTRPCVELSSERPKVLRRRQFWIIFTCTCAFRHSGRQCYHSRTSKNAPSTTVF